MTYVSDMDQKKLNITSVDKVWDELLVEFSNWKMVKPKKNWISKGMPNRINHSRMQSLMKSPMAKAYFEKTKDFSDSEFRHLNTLSRINLEQVTPAARLTMIMNVSTLLGFFLILNQVFPGFIGRALSGFLRGDFASANAQGIAYAIVCMMIFFIPFAAGVTLYCYGGVSGARDLKNLTELSLSRRGISGNNENISDILLEDKL